MLKINDIRKPIAKWVNEATISLILYTFLLELLLTNGNLFKINLLYR